MSSNIATIPVIVVLGAAAVLLSRTLARKRREAERIANLRRNEMIKERLRETPPSVKAARRGA